MIKGDCIYIDQLSVIACIGVHAWEQQAARQLKISLRLAWDIEAAAKRDDLSDTLDYAAVANQVRKIAAARPYRLLETLAIELTQALFNQWPIPALEIRIDKPDAIPGAPNVGIEIFRQRDQ